MVAINDLLTGTRRRFEDDGNVAGGEERLHFPSSNVLRYELEGGATVTARPSGTEPKIKFYFEVRIDPAGRDLAAVRAEATLELEKLVLAIEGRV